MFYILGFKNQPTDMQQIMIMISYMRGDNAAGRFADLYAQEYHPGQHMFEKFSDLLAETFLPKELK